MFKWTGAAIGAAMLAFPALAQYNVALGKPVTASGGFSGKPLSTLVDGALLPKGTQWQTNTVWWNGPTAFVVDLQGKYTLTSGIVQVDDNDSYTLEYWDEVAAQWKLLWAIPNYDQLGSGMLTRPDPDDNSKAQTFSSGIVSDRLRLRANVGDDKYSCSELTVFGFCPQAALVELSKGTTCAIINTASNPIQAIADEGGNTLQVDCVGTLFPAYHLTYTPKGGMPRLVGLCPWYFGRNSYLLVPGGDSNGDGVQDCFNRTFWTSEEYITDRCEAGFVDWYTYNFDVVGNSLTLTHWKSLDGVAGMAEDLIVERKVDVDPMTFDCTSVSPGAGSIPSLHTADPRQRCDLDGDGVCDDNDVAAAMAVIGLCEGDSGFRFPVDADFDGCISMADVNELFSPACDPGGPYVVAAGGSVLLDASNSFDLSGLPLTYQWSTTCSGAILSDPQGVQTILSIPQAGLCRVDLAVSNGVESRNCSAEVSVQGLDVSTFCMCLAGGPCGNTSSQGGCVNSTGQGAMLTAQGSTGLVQDDLVLHVSQLPAFKPGVVFLTDSKTQMPFGDGLLCAGGAAGGGYSLPVRTAGQDGEMQFGPGLVTYIDTYLSAGLIQAGSTWYLQALYRDPNGPCGTGVNLSNAISVDFKIQ